MLLVVVYAVVAYTIGFLATRGVPKGIDSGARGPAPLAAVIDALLLSLFAAQHTVMARQWFKRHWGRIVPAPAERSTFVLAATLGAGLLYRQWRPMSARASGVLLAIYAAGWVLVIGSTLAVSHADLFGLRQARSSAGHDPYTRPRSACAALTG